MAEPLQNDSADLAQPEVRSGFRISPIWIFPFVALAIGGWLVYQTLAQRGPVITITFETAEGIEEGKTKVKYREVEVGLVESVELKEDLTGVVVTMNMRLGTSAYLTEDTRFWVVRPQVGTRGVTGLGTLVSGAFIEIEPGRSGEPRTEFIGLEARPLITIDDPGKRFTLIAEDLGSYTTGSPVYYRGLEVGEVLGHKMTESRREFEVFVFIHQPHDQLIRRDTRFWNVSGINVSIDADGMDLNVESLRALALGGIAFETPGDLTSGTPSEAGSTFRLYETEEAVDEAVFDQTFRWIAYFDGSVRGLSKGAPVEFKGIRIGEVVDVRLEFERTTGQHRIPVLINIEPERVHVEGGLGVDRIVTREEHLKGLDRLIKAGLRARVKSGSLITGQLLIDLDFFPDHPVVMRGDGDIPEIPTVPSSIEEITRSLTALLDKIQGLPLDELTESFTNTAKSLEALVSSEEIPSAIRSLDETLATLNRVVSNLDTNIAPEAQSALSEARLTLQTAREALSPDSPLRYDLETTLRELSAAARSIRLLAEYLESNPNALIYGRGGRAP